MSMNKLQIDWVNTVTLTLSHLLAVGAIVYLAVVECSLWTIGLGVVWFACSGFAITGGYHRLFSHRSYQAHGLVRSFFLLFGAAAVQNSALRWSADHRRHHAQTDRDNDPYNAQRGFLWSHVGWVLCKPPHARDLDQVHDLQADPLVAFQNRYYVLLAVLMAAIVPACLGLLWGDPIGACLVAGFLRLVVQWHATFSVNSFAHILGSQPFSTRNSSRDSFWTAILTLGEGYHNYHHTFQHDYRNGIYWHHYDPTKWTLWGLNKVGLTSNLRRVPKETIIARRHKATEERRSLAQGEKAVPIPTNTEFTEEGFNPANTSEQAVHQTDQVSADAKTAPLP
jgi:stearoyl-CoA desaturase (delta-9 desaturase)